MKWILMIVLFISMGLLSGCSSDSASSKSGTSSYSTYECDYNYYNCDDFSTHAEAQRVYDYCGSGDIHRLDRDDDGLACENLP